MGFRGQAIRWRHSRDRTSRVAFLGLILLLTGFVCRIATRQLVMEGVWVVGRQNADIADTLHLRDVAMATIFWLSVVWYLATRCFILGVGFQGKAIRWRHSGDRVSTGRSHGNHFWLSIYGVHIGASATWWIRQSRPCSAAMRPYVKLLWPLVIIIITAKPAGKNGFVICVFARQVTPKHSYRFCLRNCKLARETQK